MSKYIGEEFYSDYFGSQCVVVRVISDRHWWFHSKKYNRTFKANTRLSHFMKGGEVK